MTAAEAQAEALARLRGHAGKMKRIEDDSAFSSLGCLFIGSFAALLIPIIGVFVCIVGLLVWVVELFRSLAKRYAAPPVDEHELAGLAFRLQQSVQGDCPVCRAPITFPAPSDPASATCPACRTPLFYRDGYTYPA